MHLHWLLSTQSVKLAKKRHYHVWSYTDLLQGLAMNKRFIMWSLFYVEGHRNWNLYLLIEVNWRLVVSHAKVKVPICEIIQQSTMSFLYTFCTTKHYVISVYFLYYPTILWYVYLSWGKIELFVYLYLNVAFLCLLYIDIIFIQCFYNDVTFCTIFVGKSLILQDNTFDILLNAHTFG